MKVLNKENLPYWIAAFIVLSVICFILLYFSESQIPTVFTSSGIVAIISAFIGIILTVFVTQILLGHQSETESKKDKNVRIFQEKLQVYSEFTEKMWAMLDDGSVTDKELKELRTVCFRKLVFYLDTAQINQIYEQINKVDLENDDTAMMAVGEISHVLQSSLMTDENVKSKSGDLIKLFNSFAKIEKEDSTESKFQQPNIQSDHRTYWHFNTLQEKEQIGAFKNGNWVLALIEYGEDWRTNKLKQVQPDDVIFLFKRGGAGYIGACRAKSTKVLTSEENEEGKYSNEDIKKYDIYGGLEDGATLCSNIIVEPIAYNCNGIGCQTVRRRTIERMIDDTTNIQWLLNRFNGNDLTEEQLSGKNKFDNETPVKGLNNEFLMQITKQNKP